MGDDQQGQRGLKLPGVGGLPSVGSFGVGGFVSDRLTDAVSLLSALPEIGATLQSINAHIINLDDEVILMRQGVTRLEGDVGKLRQEIEQLRAEINAVGGHVASMDERLENMEPNIDSIGRLAGILRRTRRRTRDTDAPALAPGAPQAPDAVATEDSAPVAASADDDSEELARAAQHLVDTAQDGPVSADNIEDEDEAGFTPPYGESGD
jgi:chromosome segregation ATPase